MPGRRGGGRQMSGGDGLVFGIRLMCVCPHMLRLSLTVIVSETAVGTVLRGRARGMEGEREMSGHGRACPVERR